MQFVILEHFLPSLDRPDHFDLMVQQPSQTLRTWSLRQRPDSTGWQKAISLPDHRSAYLNHQGPTKRGGGWVRRWTRGNVRPLVQHDCCWRILVESPLLTGLITVEELEPDNLWRYTFQRSF